MDENVDVTIDRVVSIVSAYVGSNPVPAGSISDLIASVHASITKLAQPAAEAPAAKEPAVNPKRSVFPDYIICLEDGKKFKSLKRHLGVHYNMTPEEYRAKWGLAANYPMVAPNYAAQRSELAKKIGLGRKPAAEAAPKKRATRKAAA
jgi:predicted transcriptional regulator